MKSVPLRRGLELCMVQSLPPASTLKQKSLESQLKLRTVVCFSLSDIPALGVEPLGKEQQRRVFWANLPWWHGGLSSQAVAGPARLSTAPLGGFHFTGGGGQGRCRKGSPPLSYVCLQRRLCSRWLEPGRDVLASFSGRQPTAWPLRGRGSPVFSVGLS